jgi:dTDP-4-dehydrorhamnose reductase
MAVEGDVNFGRILVIGASGYVGSALALALRDDYEVLGTYHQHPVRIEGTTGFAMNCLHGGEILAAVQRYNPDLVIYAAGLTSSKACEANPAIADALNFRAPMLFFKVLPKPVPFLYLSTDIVFGDASKGTMPFSEKSKPVPMNALGSSKLKGENLVLGHQRLTYVLRVPRLYGESLGGPQKPCYSWAQWLQGQLEQGASVDAFTDQVRSFAYIGDVARAVRAFVKKAPTESTLYHLAPDEALNHAQMARLYCKAMGYDPALIREAEREGHPLSAVPQPRNCALSGEAFRKEYEFRFQGAEEGLIELAERLRTGYTRGWF